MNRSVTDLPDDLKVLSMRPLRGPNQWTTAPVLECLVDLGSWLNHSSDEIPDFNDRLRAWLPGLAEHRCSIGQPGGFLERLRRGTYMAHILEHVAIELHGMAGVDTYYGRSRATNKEGVYAVVIKYKDERLARECILEARNLCIAAAKNLPFDVGAVVDRLREVARASMVPPDMQALIDAAGRRNVPCIRIGGGPLLQFGHGVRQRRLLDMQTDRLGAIAASIADDPDLLERQLNAAGIPYRRSPASEDGQSDAPAPRHRLLMVGGRMVAALEDGNRDITDEIHPAIAERAREAVEALRWDIATVYLAAGDLHKPLEDQGGAFVEFRPSANLGIHLKPVEGTSRPVDDAILDLLFAPGEDGRIPIAAVTGTNGKTTVARMLAHILKGSGEVVGLTCTDGIYVDGEQIAEGDCSGPVSARMLLKHLRVETAVFETARGGILRAGLGFDECQVAVVTNIGHGDHLGIDGVDTLDQLARVKRVPVQAVSPAGAAVLNAGDPFVADMADHCKGRVIYFATDSENAVIATHRASGGWALFVREDKIVLARGADETTLALLARIPLTMGGRVRFQVENTLAAMGAAIGMGVQEEALASHLSSFAPDLDHDPLRFNVFEYRGATVVVDFGHNADALEAVIDGLGVFPPCRRTAVFSSAGDRRDEDILRMGELLGASFDRVILYEDTDMYDRQPGEIIGLLRRGMAASGRVPSVEEVQGGMDALRLGLETVGAGELLVAQAHMAAPALEYLRGCGGLSAGRI